MHPKQGEVTLLQTSSLLALDMDHFTLKLILLKLSNSH